MRLSLSIDNETGRMRIAPIAKPAIVVLELLHCSAFLCHRSLPTAITCHTDFLALIQLLQHRGERLDACGRVRLQPDLDVRETGVGVGTQPGGDLRRAAG
jgi:hypothetical protein